MTDDRIVAATVQLPKRGGQGVLIRGGLVMTAAHCIEWNADGGMAMGDWQVETVETACGKSFRMHPVFVEPRSDIALLGAPDGGEPEFASDWEFVR